MKMGGGGVVGRLVVSDGKREIESEVSGTGNEIERVKERDWREYTMRRGDVRILVFYGCIESTHLSSKTACGRHTHTAVSCIGEAIF